jgi:hypothetical protein
MFDAVEPDRNSSEVRTTVDTSGRVGVVVVGGVVVGVEPGRVVTDVPGVVVPVDGIVVSVAPGVVVAVVGTVVGTVVAGKFFP